jgi:catalase
VLNAAGLDLDAAGIIVGSTVDKDFSSALVQAMGLHRAWDRADDHGVGRALW